METGGGIDWTGLSLPFSASDLIASGNGLLSIVGTFVLLALAFVFAPKIIALIRQAFASRSKG